MTNCWPQISDSIDRHKAKNTVNKTKSDVGIIIRWFDVTLPSELGNLEEISPAQLSTFLNSFYLRVRKRNRSEYEPETLISIKYSIDRYLCENTYGYSVCRGMSLKGKQLNKDGKGRKPKEAEEVTAEEENV